MIFLISPEDRRLDFFFHLPAHVEKMYLCVRVYVPRAEFSKIVTE